MPIFLSGGGEAGRLIRQHDWTGTTLGAPDLWPQSLKTLVGIMLGAKQPMFVAWGADLTLLYNDGYSEILGKKHPDAMGRPFFDIWSEIAADLRPIVEEALGGVPVHMEDITLHVERHGYPEEAHFTFSYTPVRGDGGEVEGFFCPCTETTKQILAERRVVSESDRQRRLFALAPGFITILHGPEHVFEFVNEAYSRLFGGRDFVGRSVRQVFPELEGQGFFDWLDQVYATGERHVAHQVPVDLQIDAIAPVEHRFLDFIYEPVTDDLGRVTGIFCEGHDVTERVEAQSALHASEERYRQIVEGAEDFAIITQDENGILQSWNRGAERLIGFREEEAIGKPSAIFFTDEDKAAGMPDHEMNRARESGRFVDERWHQRKDGARFWGSGLMMSIEGGGFLKMFRDRTTEHEAEAALRKSEEQFRAFAQAMPNHVWTSRTDGVLDWFNDRIYEYSGLTYEELAGSGWTSIVHDDDLPSAMQTWSASLESGRPYEAEFRLRRSGGGYRWHIARAVMINAGIDGAELWVGTNTDIEDQKLAVTALADLNRNLEQQVAERTADRDRVWRNSRDLLAILGTDGVFRALNPAWQEILGYSPQEMVGRSFRDFVWPEDVDLTADAVATAVTTDLTAFENRYRHKDAAARWISWHSSTEGDLIFAYGRDVTLEKQRQADLELAQEALRQSQKLEAMGQLTGGVAHDFNNLLTPIVGSLDLLQRRQLGSEREQRLIAGAIQSAERARTLVQRLLAFARRQPLQTSAVDIPRLVSGMAELVASTSGPQIDVVIDVPTDLPPAKADPNQLEMAVLNLSVNARDAMPRGGTMTISARCDQVEAASVDVLKPGRYIRLSVTDTGVGMDEEILKRAIEPFYSTKGIGKGTGLGLSMVHGLASQLGGALKLWSKPGEGTKIDLWLPLSEEPLYLAEPLTTGTPIGRAAATALLVDDEDAVRMTTADMLSDLGYEVEEASSGEMALRLLESGRSFDLVVTDHLMPGMTGAELAAVVQGRWVGVPVLIVSGYSGAHGISPDLPRLMKPFRQSELQAILAGMMPARTRAPRS
jgi:PAS domain S-box-containing protein